MKTIEQVVDGLNQEFAPARPVYRSVMKKVYARSPDIRSGMTPWRASRKLARTVRMYSRRVRHVYWVEFGKLLKDGGVPIITARLFVLRST